MQVSEVARRYANALFTLVSSNGSFDVIVEDLKAIKQALTKDPEFLKMLNAPVVSSSDRIEFIQKTFGTTIKSEKLKDFLSLLVDKGRIYLLLQIIESFEKAVDEKNDVLRGTVKTAAPIESEQRKSLEESVSKRLNKGVALEYEEDKSLVGGIRIEVGSYLFDGSIETQIRMLNDDITRSIR